MEYNQNTTQKSDKQSGLTQEERQRIHTYHMWGTGKLGKNLGYGSFGKVFELQEVNSNGTSDAVKLVTIQYDAQKAEKHGSKEEYLLDGLRGVLDEIRKMMEFRDLKNFVSIYGYETYPIRVNGELEGYDILIRMEKLQPLRAYIKQQKSAQTYDETVLIRLGIDICTALIEATQLISQKAQRKIEFIHRDIKPGNIFVSADGTFKLGDLGTAAMSEHTVYTSVGTPSYMAPEMFTRGGYHANVDLYALGKTLEKLSEGMTLTSGLQQVIKHAEDYPAEQRYQTAQDMRADLYICLKRVQSHTSESEETLLAEQLTQAAPEYTTKYQDPPEAVLPVQAKSNRKKWLWLAVIPIAAVLSVGGWFGYHAWQTQQLQQQEEQQKAAQAEQLQQSITALRDEISQDMSAQDYSTAIARLQENAELVAQSEELQQMQESCEQSYRTEITRQAAEAYHTQDNKAAMELIAQGLSVLPEDNALTQLSNQYADCEPVSLLDLAVQDTNLDRNTFSVQQEISDRAGNTYHGSIQIAGSVGLIDWNKTAGYCTYNLNEKYQYFQFSYFIQQTGANLNDVWVKVFADEICIYDSDLTNASQDTTDVDLDVTGCSVLKIECTVNDRVFWDKPSAVIVQPVLKKKIQ